MRIADEAVGQRPADAIPEVAKEAASAPSDNIRQFARSVGPGATVAARTAESLGERDESAYAYHHATSDEVRRKLERMERSLNYGAYYNYRTQRFVFPDADPTQPAAHRSAYAHILDLWFRLLTPRWRVEAELAGSYPGDVVLARQKPDTALLRKAAGHKQIMDFWLVQIAREHACTLATNDSGLAATWPDVVERIAVLGDPGVGEDLHAPVEERAPVRLDAFDLLTPEQHDGGGAGRRRHGRELALLVEAGLTPAEAIRALGLSSPMWGLSLKVPAVKGAVARMLGLVAPTYLVDRPGFGLNPLSHDIRVVAAFVRDLRAVSAS